MRTRFFWSGSSTKTKIISKNNELEDGKWKWTNSCFSWVKQPQIRQAKPHEPAKWNHAKLARNRKYRWYDDIWVNNKDEINILAYSELHKKVQLSYKTTMEILTEKLEEFEEKHSRKKSNLSKIASITIPKFNSKLKNGPNKMTLSPA
jgi:hypothetical protein